MTCTKYEKARVVGARALQISMGAPIQTDLKKKDLEELNYNPIRIAMREFDLGVIPIDIKRKYPDGSEEIIKAE